MPGDGDQNDYERVERLARLVAGEEIAVWVYVYRKSVAPSSLIPGGRWGPGANSPAKAALHSRPWSAVFTP